MSSISSELPSLHHSLCRYIITDSNTLCSSNVNMWAAGDGQVSSSHTVAAHRHLCHFHQIIKILIVLHYKPVNRVTFTAWKLNLASEYRRERLAGYAKSEERHGTVFFVCFVPFFHHKLRKSTVDTFLCNVSLQRFFTRFSRFLSLQHWWVLETKCWCCFVVNVMWVCVFSFSFLSRRSSRMNKCYMNVRM